MTTTNALFKVHIENMPEALNTKKDIDEYCKLFWKDNKEKVKVAKAAEKAAKAEKSKQKNKGTGAGGLNTNKNGLSYEKLTDLDDKATILKKTNNGHGTIIYFNDSAIKFVKAEKTKLFKYMGVDKNMVIGHGCKQPDECYIQEELNNIFIIEKKFQQKSGSVCEKVQSSHYKLWEYSRIFPNYNIIYIYCLSEWFKKNCTSELEYLDAHDVKYFWGNSEAYKDDIINFMVNYK
jgi:hypothetical protein